MADETQPISGPWPLGPWDLGYLGPVVPQTLSPWSLGPDDVCNQKF